MLLLATQRRAAHGQGLMSVNGTQIFCSATMQIIARADPHHCFKSYFRSKENQCRVAFAASLANSYGYRRFARMPAREQHPPRCLSNTLLLSFTNTTRTINRPTAPDEKKALTVIGSGPTSQFASGIPPRKARTLALPHSRINRRDWKSPFWNSSDFGTA